MLGQKGSPHLRYLAGKVVICRFRPEDICEIVLVTDDPPATYGLKLKNDQRLNTVKTGRKYIVLYYTFDDKPLNELVAIYEIVRGSLV